MHQWVPYTTPPVHVTVEDDEAMGGGAEGEGEEEEGAQEEGGATFTIAPADHTLGNMFAAVAEAHPGTVFSASRCERMGQPKVVLRIDTSGGGAYAPRNIFENAVHQTAETLATLRASWESHANE